MTKVLIVDDSTFIRKTIRQMLSYDPEIEVIDEAGDGREAIEKTLLLKPDVITMDVIMPGVDGIWALEEVMKQRPTPVIIVSSVSINVSDIAQEAFSLGVIDIVLKPNSPQNIPIIRRELIEKVKAASRIDKFRLLDYKLLRATTKKPAAKMKSHQIVIIVTSAGGPPSLYEVISKFSSRFFAGIVVAQHMPSNFVPSFVNHIQKLTPMPIKIADKGDILYSRRILFSPTDNTLQLHHTKKGAVVDLIDYKTRLQPDIDKVITSCANVFKSGTVLVVLSGLGNDGVKGAEIVKNLGGKVIVEDKSTAGLYGGMPSSVIKSGYYDIICPSYSIAETIEKYFDNKPIDVNQKKFLVKGIVLRSAVSFLKNNCSPDIYGKIFSELNENDRSTINTSLNSNNYYPEILYYTLLENIDKICKDVYPDIIQKLSQDNAVECFKIYQQGFPLSNPEHFIKYLPTYQKVLFPGSSLGISELDMPSKKLSILMRSEEYSEKNIHILARYYNEWLKYMLETVKISIAEVKNEIGEDNSGWYIKCLIRLK